MCVTDDMLEALLVIQHDNPVLRKTERFVEWLEYSGHKATEADLVCMIKNSCQGEKVCKKHSEIMQYEILSNIGKHKLHQKYPQVWALVEDDFDAEMSKLWAKSMGKDTPIAMH